MANSAFIPLLRKVRQRHFIPPALSAEFFGFYNIFGKFATIIGPFLTGIISRMTGDFWYGILSILILFVAGGVALIMVDKSSPDS